MRAHVVTAKERRIIKEVASLSTQRAVEAKLQDAVIRSHYMCFAAMLKAGLSARTVNRVAAMLDQCAAEYAEYKTDELADYIFHKKIVEAGVPVPMTKDEQ